MTDGADADGRGAEGHGPDRLGAEGRALLDAFRALEPALRRFIGRRITDAADVDDILQDMAARILAREADAPVDNKSAFLFSVASNLIRDRHRRGLARRGREHVALDNVEIADPAALQDQVVDARLRLRRFWTALGALPGREREVFVLHKLEGRSLAEVAEDTGLSLAQVRKLVEHALGRLARRVWKD